MERTDQCCAQKKYDAIVATHIFLIAAAASFYLASHIPEVLYTGQDIDVWYNADANRVFRHMHTAYDARDLLLHPLFSLFMRPFAQGITLLGLTTGEASTLVVAASAGAVAALLFLTVRGLHLSGLNAGLICAMFVVSGSFTFWWSIVETFPIGAVTISLLFLILVNDVRSPGLWAVASVLTFSITVTNGFVSIMGLYLKFGIWKTQKIMVVSLGMAVVLLVMQQVIYPISIPVRVETSVYDAIADEATTFHPTPVFAKVRLYVGGIVTTYLKECRFIYSPPMTGKGFGETASKVLRGYAERMASFFVYPGAAPRPVLGTSFVSHAALSPAPRIETEFLAYGPSGVLAVGCWVILLLGGLKEILSRAEMCLFSKFLLYVLAFQFTLHMLYGHSPFLYSAHFVVALLLLVACGFRGEDRVILQIVGVAFCGSVVLNNLKNFFDASEYLSTFWR